MPEKGRPQPGHRLLYSRESTPPCWENASRQPFPHRQVHFACCPLAELQPGLPRSPRLELWLLLPFIHCDWALRSTGRTMVPPAARLLDSFWRGSDRGNRIAPPLAGHRPVPRHAGGAAFHWFRTHPPCRRSTRSISRRTKRWPSSAGWSRGTGSTSWPATTASSGSDSSAGRRAGRIPARTRP